MNKKEVWFYRIGIIMLFIWCIVLAQGNKQAQYMGLKNADGILENSKEITGVLENQKLILLIQQGQSEDYPAKMKLGDREWCKDRICLIGTGVE